MSKANRTTVSIRATDEQLEMLDTLRAGTGMPTRSGALMFALAQTYSKMYPAYRNKPTPMHSDTPSRVVSTAKARVLNKKIQSEEEENAIVESGKQIASLLSARITNEGKGIKEIGMRVERLDGVKIAELSADILLTEIPHTYYQPLAEDTQLQAYVLEMKFRDLDLSASPERLHSKLDKIAKNMEKAIERGDVKPKHFSIEVCNLLLEKMEENSVDNSELKESLLEFGFLG